MSTSLIPDRKIWNIAEGKARLSELLRLVREDGPQYIDTKKSFVVISEEQWLLLKQPKKSLERWLIENIPTVGELELPDRNEPDHYMFEGLHLAGMEL